VHMGECGVQCWTARHLAVSGVQMSDWLLRTGGVWRVMMHVSVCVAIDGYNMAPASLPAWW
jgi:hypothetical protein